MEAALETAPDPATYSPRAIGTGLPMDRAALLNASLRSAPRPEVLDAPVTTLKGAGPKLTEAAAEIGIESLGDLVQPLVVGGQTDPRDAAAIAGQAREAGVQRRGARVARR